MTTLVQRVVAAHLVKDITYGPYDETVICSCGQEVYAAYSPDREGFGISYGLHIAEIMESIYSGMLIGESRLEDDGR